MSTFTNTAREVEMPNGDVVVIHNAPTGGENTTSNIKKFKYDDNGHVTESTAADAEDLNLSSYSTPTTGTTAIGTSDDVQTAIGKLDHQSHIDQTNILYALETGAANYAPLEGDSKTGSGYFLNATSKGMNIIPSGTTVHVYCEYTKIANTQFSIQLTNVTGDVIGSTTSYAPGASTSGTLSVDVTPNVDAYGYNAYYNGASGNTCTLTKVMICPKNVWDAIQKYVPYSIPNYDLTRLEAEDRAGLVDVVDSAAKNRLNYDAWKGCPVSAGSAVYENNGVTLTATGDDCFTVYTPSEFPESARITGKTGETIILSWDCEVADNVGGAVYIFPNGSTTGMVTANIRDKKLEYTFTSGITYITFRVGVRGVGSVAKYKNIMVATKAAFGVSQKFEPYRPDYDTLLGMLITKYPRHVANSARTYTIKMSVAHLLHIQSYDNYMTGIVFTYDQEQKVRFIQLAKSEPFDQYFTVAFSTDGSRTITITPTNTSYWFVSNMISLG